MRITPIHPHDIVDAEGVLASESVTRRTFGMKFPSRRTFGGKFPSRRTFGAKFPSRRTFGIRWGG